MQILRIVVLLFGMIAIFAAVAIVLRQVIPGPHTSTDYLVIGTISTFISLTVLFVVLIKTWVKTPDLFYKRKEK
ncbi:MAG: hypothetical protein GY953_10055 [bacterium]|nr:hypothetical protein [bacterium]